MEQVSGEVGANQPSADVPSANAPSVNEPSANAPSVNEPSANASVLAAPTSARPVLAWMLAVGLLLHALTASLLGSALIDSSFPDRPRPDDLLFTLLPYVGAARYLTVVALVGGFGAFLVDTLRRDRTRLPEYISVFALMYLMRAVIMVLTPLGSAQGEGAFVFSQQQFGMFPSGHVAACTLLVMLTPTDRGPWLPGFQQLLLVLMCAGLLLAHGHYSIDVVGGLLLGHFVVHTWRSGRLFARFRRITGP
ncbi:PAP2 superfamily C-terminal [Raineyella antarctica]|uniref:PAP2 superfamily C-terminal n=1 Tax=Raineyella antarctica TaxID=1577474 RepID=A0A1G6I4T2_9ACTN|nr:phosphatase PAP2-related protein [Raineyella antarctica]SDC01065.1 PAP2 superfamily C-terminal [Raineyella antarctica]